MKQLKKAMDGASAQLKIILFMRSVLTVFIPFTIPTPLIPPIIQYVVEMGITTKVKSNTHQAYRGLAPSRACTLPGAQ